MLAVVDAPTSELATQATASYKSRNSPTRRITFHSIAEGGGGPFFQKERAFVPSHRGGGRLHQENWAKPNL